MKVVAFLVKRDDLDRDALIEHYEGHHVPLILSLAPAPTTYARNYLRRAPGAPRGDDVDIITELTFPDADAHARWVAAMYAPGSGVAADEETFLDRSRTRSFVVDEHVTDATPSSA